MELSKSEHKLRVAEVMLQSFAGRNMSIISKVGKNRSLSIEFDTYQSTVIENR